MLEVPRGWGPWLDKILGRTVTSGRLRRGTHVFRGLSHFNPLVTEDRANGQGITELGMKGCQTALESPRKPSKLAAWVLPSEEPNLVLSAVWALEFLKVP